MALTPFTQSAGTTFVRVLMYKDNAVFAKKVEAGTEGAVNIPYEDDNKNIVDSFNLIYGTLEGVISEIKIEKGNFGDNIEITVDGVMLSIPKKGRYGEDFLKKAPFLKPGSIVSLKPFKFSPADNPKKTMSGITIIQDGEKLKNFFFNYKEDGFPEFPAKGSSTDEYSMYNMQTLIIMSKYLTEKVAPLFSADIAESTPVKEAPVPVVPTNPLG